MGGAEELPNAWLLDPAGSLVPFLSNEIVIAGLTKKAIALTEASPWLFRAAAKGLPQNDKQALLALSRLMQQGRAFVLGHDALEVRAVDSGRLLARAALPGWPAFIYSLPANRFVVELHGGAICVVEAAAVEG